MGWIYCLFSLRYFYFKIGLSKTPLKRLRDIRKSVRDDLKKHPVIIPIFGIIVWDMDAVERKIHGVVKFWNFKWKGSGSSEWHKSKLIFIDVFFALLIALVLMVLFQLETLVKLTVIAQLAIMAIILIIYLIRVF